MMQMQLFTNMGCYSSTHLTRISTPRFLGKKRGKGCNGLQWSSKAHDNLLFWRGWPMLSWNFNFFLRDSYSTELRERGNNCRKMDLWEDRVLHGQLMETGFHKHILSWQTWNTWKCEKEWEKFQIWYAKSWVHLSYTRKPSKGEHWMCNMVVAKEGSDIDCFFFKNMVSRVDIACLEPCSTTSLYPYWKLYRTFW
jgi:hypothetical protein